MSHLAQRGRKADWENMGAVYAKDPDRHISTVRALSDRAERFQGRRYEAMLETTVLGAERGGLG